MQNMQLYIELSYYLTPFNCYQITHMAYQSRLGLTINLTNTKEQKEPEFQWISDFVKQFKKNIQEPITLRQSIMKNSQLQRCLAHNIIYSIYCTVCRKVLCASCMYTTMLHRKHRVVPVENALEEIRQDLRVYQTKVPKIIQHCEEIGQASNQYLLKMQKEFTPVILRLQQFYENLRSFIKIKQKQQITALKDKKEEIRAEVSAFSKQISKIQQYISEKCKSYVNPNIKSELLIPSRNIIENLMQTYQYIRQPEFNGQNRKYCVDEDKIKTAYTDVTQKITQFILDPIVSKVPEFKKIGSSRSPSRKSTTPTFSREKKRSQQKKTFPDPKKPNSSVAGIRTVRKL